MTRISDVFLSYTKSDDAAATELHAQLLQSGWGVFRDERNIELGELWLNRLQEEIQSCRSFVILVGLDGIRRWSGAEAQVALLRHFDPRQDSDRLPIYPILLPGVERASLPAFLRLFQSCDWNGKESLPQSLLDKISSKVLSTHSETVFNHCPFVGLESFGIDQDQLFFGRELQTLNALKSINTRSVGKNRRWLEIYGDSGCGKSSLMRAGILPLVTQGWLWPRTGFEYWKLIGPMMPGVDPIGMLAEYLAQSFDDEMTDVRHKLEKSDDDRVLAEWLRSRKKANTAFLLAIDQFEELFTFWNSDSAGRKRFDRLLATALMDQECPLFVISTVRVDFFHKYSMLPQLYAIKNLCCESWALPQIDENGLRNIISGPARLANLDVSEVQEIIINSAMDESGGAALPLVENALSWLWQNRIGNKLSGRLLKDSGGIAGILVQSADELLASLGKRREKALNLLFNLVQIDQEGHHHARRPTLHENAVTLAGGGTDGLDVIGRLSSQRTQGHPGAASGIRLVSVSEETPSEGSSAKKNQWVNLVHDTLISARRDDRGMLKPTWPTLWDYIEKNKFRAVRRDRLRFAARDWKNRNKFAKVLGLMGWLDLLQYRNTQDLSPRERDYLHWSLGRALVSSILASTIVVVAVTIAYWAISHSYDFRAVVKYGRFLSNLDRPFPKTVKIPGGPFLMGASSKDWKSRKVTISDAYYLSETEITFDQYDIYAMATRKNLPYDSGWGRGDQPVTIVSWYDAVGYAKWLSKQLNINCRLPSEVEWEMGCRAGFNDNIELPLNERCGLPSKAEWENACQKRSYSELVPPVDVRTKDLIGAGFAICEDCSSNPDDPPLGPSPVKSVRSNAFGLYNMQDNVWEWVQDCWHKESDDAPQNGDPWVESKATAEGKCKTPVVRGGAWIFNHVDASCFERNPHRGSLQDNYTGFRIRCDHPIP